MTDMHTTAILQREAQFPTGLPVTPYGVAIPHTDGTYVLKPQLAFASLKNPVVFQEMGNRSREIQVTFILCLLCRMRMPT